MHINWHELIGCHMLLYFDIICPTLASPTEISKSRQAQSRNTQRQLPPFTKPTKTSQSVYDNTNTDGTQGKDREENTNSAHRNKYKHTFNTVCRNSETFLHVCHLQEVIQ